MVKKVTAPKTYDPGKGRPKEHLAYLNEREMAYLRSLNNGSMSRGPRGLPSFAEETVGPGGSSRGAGGKGSAGPSSSGAGGQSSASSGARGAGSNYGPGSSRPGTTSSPVDNRVASPAPQTAVSPMSNQGASFASPSVAGSYNADKIAQQKSQISGAISAVKQTPAVRNDLAVGGVRSINVGPMGTPVSVGKPSKAEKAITPAEAYRPSAISPGGLATPGSIPISRAMNFAESAPGMRDPKMAQAIKDAALSGKSMFSVSGATPAQQALIDQIGPTVLSVSMNTGLDPRTIIGQALTESTTAKHPSKVSKLARDANNLFGVKATGSPNQFWGGDVVKMPTKETVAGKTFTTNEPFRKYDSPEQALMDYARIMQSDRYKKAAEFSTPEEQLTAIRSSGYATHPSKSYVDMGVKNASRSSFGGTSPTLASAQPPSRTASASPTMVSASLDPTAAIRSAFKTAQGYYNSLPSLQDIGNAYTGLQKQLADYNAAKTGMFSSVTGPIADERMKEAITKATSQGIEGLKGFVNTAIGSSTIGRPQMASATKTTPQTTAAPEEEKVLAIENVPEERVAVRSPDEDIEYSYPEAPVYKAPVQIAAARPPVISGTDRGVYRQYIPAMASETTTGKKTKNKSSGRPQQYYNWDTGVGIPSPSDPDYTLYLKYLQEKAAAQAAV